MDQQLELKSQRRHSGGRRKMPLEERKMMVFGYVKSIHVQKVQKMIDELVKK